MDNSSTTKKSFKNQTLKSVKVERDLVGKSENAKFRSNNVSNLPADDGGENFQNN